jgi:hypothetical protein
MQQPRIPYQHDTGLPNFPPHSTRSPYQQRANGGTVHSQHYLFNPATQEYIMAPTHPNFQSHGHQFTANDGPYDYYQQQLSAPNGYPYQFPVGAQSGYYRQYPPAQQSYGSTHWGQGYITQPLSIRYEEPFRPCTLGAFNQGQNAEYCLLSH